MLFTQYVEKAMQSAEYEFIEDGTFFASIPGFDGLWGNAKTVELCRNDLRGALESWLIAKLWDRDDDIPVLGKLSLYPRRVRIRAESSKEPVQDAAASSSRNRKAS
jgi:predicted RNase H-like HicB family nuclease